MLVVGGALLFRGYLLVNWRTRLISRALDDHSDPGVCRLLFVDYFLISGGFFNATVHLVLFVMVVRLFSAHRDRDRYFLAVLAFLMVLAAAVLTVDSVFLFAFAALSWWRLSRFVLMEMRHAPRKATVSRANRAIGGPIATWRLLLWRVASRSLCCAFFSGGGDLFCPAALFGWLFECILSRYELSTGFSDQVQLGQIGQIQQSSSVVMHIQIDGDKERKLQREMARHHSEQF